MFSIISLPFVWAIRTLQNIYTICVQSNLLINKVLKDKKQKPIPKNTNLIGDKYLKLAFESLRERVLQLKKDKSLTKDETEILLLAINKAIDHGPLLDKYDDIDQRILSAQKILRRGRTKPNLSAALDLIMEREKGTKHAQTDWHRIADDYGVLTEDREPWEAIKELVRRHKFPSEQALIRGLKRFKKRTSDPVFKKVLKTLPYLDEPLDEPDE